MYMRKLIFTLLLLLPVSAWAAGSDGFKATCNVITYKADGSVLADGYGFFITADGQGVAPYSLFKGAVRADVVDLKGTRHSVSRILGANSTYDLVRFQLEPGAKTTALQVSATAVGENAALLLARYSKNKKENMMPVVVNRVADFEQYKYLTTSAANESRNFGLPLLADDGSVVAVVQRNVADNAEGACAIDARFIAKLVVDSVSALSSDLRGVRIPKALPQGLQSALLYTYMIGQTADSLMVHTALSDFCQQYPGSAEGYVRRARFLAGRGRFSESEADFRQALAVARAEEGTTPAEVHSEWSKLLMQKAVYQSEPAVEGWTLERAAQEATLAVEAAPQSPYYLLGLGRCRYAQKQYREAYEVYLRFCHMQKEDGQWNAYALAEPWLFAARSLEQAGGDSLEVIALIDSAISVLPQPYTAVAAGYMLQRAERLARAGQYRRAVQDYNEYEKTVGVRNLNAQFYYTREQLEIKAKMYQQAVDDIRMAVAVEPRDPLYAIEQAALFVRLGMNDEAIEVLYKVLSGIPDDPDANKLIGVAYGEKGLKTKAQEYLAKAKAAGDATVDDLIEKYK